MPGLSAGLATFNSCNKAGAIPHFTQHLKTSPNDYTALIWRGRAYGIVGNTKLATQDFAKAASVSSGHRRLLAQYQQRISEGNAQGGITCLEQALREYPNSEEVLATAGTKIYLGGNRKGARPILEKSVGLFETNGTTQEPSYCWTKYYLGNVYLYDVEIDRAVGTYEGAVRASGTLTVAHLGIAHGNLIKDNEWTARIEYQTARGLNPTLVHWDTFEKFRDNFFSSGGDQLRIAYLTTRGQANPYQSISHRMATGLRMSSASARSGESSRAQRGGSGGGAGGGGGARGGGGGNGSDNEDDDDKWKQMKRESKWIMKYGDRIFVQSPCGKLWYTRNLGKGHAGAFVKVYEDKGSTIKFKGSCDRNLRFMEYKHESMAGTSIKKSDMHTVWRR